MVQQQETDVVIDMGHLMRGEQKDFYDHVGSAWGAAVQHCTCRELWHLEARRANRRARLARARQPAVGRGLLTGAVTLGRRRQPTCPSPSRKGPQGIETDLLPCLPWAGPSQMAEAEAAGAGICTHRCPEAWGREKRGGEASGQTPAPGVVHMTSTSKGV